ncbi:DUF6443 domain-containing protein [Flavobacterium sp. GSA192]|uniref:DUF6443 domain-containing protein n=1 Tax=Flavobacterium sp. GSA192 TaxID=2576304 RepID=UPI001128DA96|nr:DUF6443 domain-containing protein [Flavobacterium sp. GSA192]
MNKNYKYSFFSTLLLLTISLLNNTKSFAQSRITGPLAVVGATSTHYGDREIYRFQDPSSWDGSFASNEYEFWWYTDGTILTPEDSYNQTEVEIQWDSPGQKNITVLYDGNYDSTLYYAELEVNVQSSPGVPEPPYVINNNCTQIVLQRDSPPMGGITWYWQSSATGTSTANSSPTITLTSGTEYFLRAYANGQWSSTSSSVQYNIQPNTPIVGAITHPTTTVTTGSVVLSNLPNDGMWFISPVGVSGYGTTATVTGLSASTTYNFTVTNASGCTSNASASVVINGSPSGQLPVPTIGVVTQPTCAINSASFTITNYNPAYTYTATPSTGVSFSGNIVTIQGGYGGNYTIKASSGTSNSYPSENIAIHSGKFTPSAPTVGTITQPSATATGSVVLSNLPLADWIINPGNVSGSGTTTLLTGLAPSAQPYNFTVTNSSGCTSTPSTNVLINGYCGISDENYIHTITPTVATTNVAALNNNQKIENITYYDGIGRPLQNIGIRAGEVVNDITGSMVLNDIISPIEYDEFGRQTKEYLPYSDTFNCGAFRGTTLTNAIVTGFYNNSKYENTTNPYSEKEFEASPLNRVLKQAAPGNDWRLGGGHEIKMDYQSNGGSEVKNFGVSLSFANNTYTPTLTLSTVNSGYYNANELYKTVTKDENWITGNEHTTEEFKDKQGKVVLKRTYNNGAHDTYYIYDDYGNLTYVIPPKVNTTDGVSQAELDELCYQYKYDHRNRLVEKKLPGKGTDNDWEEIVYNRLDQPILTRDPNLKAQNKWLFIKYDAFGRVAYTGLINNNNSSRIDMQSAANGTASQYVIQSATAITIAGTTIHYNNDAYPTVGINDKLHTINYYDNYSFDIDGGVSEPVGSNPQITPSTATKGLVTGSKIRVLGENSWITNVIYYDDKGRSIYNYSNNNYLGVVQKVKTELDFVGKPTKTTTTHERNNVTTTVVDTFVYDSQGRLLTQTQKINTQPEELIVSNEYDELGQLKGKGVGGKVTDLNRLQTVAYTYNIRGWLKGINDVNAMGNDLFTFKINYDKPTDLTKALFNGNISQTLWKTANTDTVLEDYTYTYDALNRLTDAKYSLEDRYNETLSYDKNGNIMSLIRKGYTDTNATILGTMDNLVYTYDAGNKLFKVEDSSNSTEGFKDGSHTAQEYGYDVNGNMTSDNNKGISTITYNHLNLPTSVTMAGGTINYTYDAKGVKQRKVAAGTTTDYAGGFQYKDAVLQFLPTTEGYAEYNATNGIFSYIYQYKDHLGNVRLSYKDVGTTTPSLQIVEESNYYPFGLKQKVAGEAVINSSYKYKYQGQERQDELGLNWDSFKWRNYDYTIGKFMSIDPLAEKYPYNSTYAFQENKMGMGVELEGLELVAKNPLSGFGNYVKGKFDSAIRSIQTTTEKAVQAVSNAVSSLEVNQVDGYTVTGSKTGISDNTGFFPEAKGAKSSGTLDGDFVATLAEAYAPNLDANKIMNGANILSGFVEKIGIPVAKKINLVSNNSNSSAKPIVKAKDTTITVSNNSLYAVPHGNSAFLMQTNYQTKNVTVPNNKKSVDSANNAAAKREQQLTKEVNESIKALE